MNHTTLAIVAILATSAMLTTVGASALPQQQAFAHSGHHGGNSIKVDNQVYQQNHCKDAFCLNNVETQADIGQ